MDEINRKSWNLDANAMPNSSPTSSPNPNPHMTLTWMKSIGNHIKILTRYLGDTYIFSQNSSKIHCVPLNQPIRQRNHMYVYMYMYLYMYMFSNTRYALWITPHISIGGANSHDLGKIYKRIPPTGALILILILNSILGKIYKRILPTGAKTLESKDFVEAALFRENVLMKQNKAASVIQGGMSGTNARAILAETDLETANKNLADVQGDKETTCTSTCTCTCTCTCTRSHIPELLTLCFSVRSYSRQP